MGIHVLITLARKRELLQAEADAEAMRRALFDIRRVTEDAHGLIGEPAAWLMADQIDQILDGLRRAAPTPGGI